MSAHAELSRLDVALPFLVAIVLTAISAFVGEIVLGRLADQLEKWAGEQGVMEKLPETFKPASISQLSGWTVDCAQVLAGLLAPLVGLILLDKHGSSSELQLAYLAAFAISFGAFVCLLRRDPSKYGTGWPRVLTPAVALALILNIGGAVAAYLIGP